MKLEEIDCNEVLWEHLTCNLQNGWANLENECRFAFKTKDESVTEDDIDSAFCDKFPSADQINVTKIEDVESDEAEEGMIYFGVSMIIYESQINL